MAARDEMLRAFQGDGADDEAQSDGEEMAWIGEAEEQPGDAEGSDMLDLKSGDVRTKADGRQSREGDAGKAENADGAKGRAGRFEGPHSRILRGESCPKHVHCVRPLLRCTTKPMGPGRFPGTKMHHASADCRPLTACNAAQG